ncbi:MAG: hypothetical protein ACLS7Z_01500 [Christensenellales bacterium]
MPTMTQAGYTPPQKSMPPKAKSPKKPKKNKKRQKGIGTAGVVSLVIFLIAVLIGSCTLFLYAQTAPYADKFLPNTSISGYALGGLTAQEGAAALAMLTDDAVSAWQYTLTWGDHVYAGRRGGSLRRYAATSTRFADRTRREYAHAVSGDAVPSRGRTRGKAGATYDMDVVDAF